MTRKGKSPKRVPFATKIPRPRKRATGRALAAETPLSLRASGVEVSPELRDYVRQRIGFRLGKFAHRIERVTVRFEDVNGPRGGVDTLCRIKVVLSGLPSVVVDELAAEPQEAFRRADGRVERAVRRDLGRARSRGLARVRPVLPAVALAKKVPRAAEPGSRIGRRVGRSAENLEGLLDRGARRRGMSGTAARNVERRARKATATLEDSARERPSRKSTRKGANRAKQGSKQARRQTRRVTSSKARARRSAARAR